jgi:hypothetical protein
MSAHPAAPETAPELRDAAAGDKPAPERERADAWSSGEVSRSVAEILEEERRQRALRERAYRNGSTGRPAAP